MKIAHVPWYLKSPTVLGTIVSLIAGMALLYSPHEDVRRTGSAIVAGAALALYGRGRVQSKIEAPPDPEHIHMISDEDLLEEVSRRKLNRRGRK